MSDIPGVDELREAAREEDELEATEWRDLESTLDGALAEAVRKVENGRIRDPERERVRIRWIRALTALVAERRNLLEKRQEKRFEAVSERLETIEEVYEMDDGPDDLGERGW